MSCCLVSERWGILMGQIIKMADMHAAFLWIHHCLSLYLRDTASVKLPNIGWQKIKQVKSKCFIPDCHQLFSTNLQLSDPYGAQIQYLKKLKHNNREIQKIFIESNRGYM